MSSKQSIAKQLENNPNWKHGDSRLPEYHAWQQMKDRCNNSNNKSYKNYGGRGIKVCDRWLDFTNFLEDMKYKPSPNYTLGRINNEGDYDPVNCEWQTYTKQERNTRRVKLTMVDAREIRMLYNRGWHWRDLAKEFNVSKSAIYAVITMRNWRE